MANNGFSGLIFRRQFLLTTKPCPQLSSWKMELMDRLFLYVHPDMDHAVVQGEDNQLLIALIGYIMDPGRPEASNVEILEDLRTSHVSPDRITEFLFDKVGRFVLMVKWADQFLIFHDACGLRTVYYSNEPGDICIASQPKLLGIATSLRKERIFDHYYSSEYVRKNIEHWIPAGISLYENVDQLLPNHYLDVNRQRQVRYWPNHEVRELGLERTAHLAAEILRGTIRAAQNRFKLALPLTAGWDSRTLLSACKEVANEIYFYTLQYRTLSHRSADVRIPKRLLLSLGCEHHTIPCNSYPDDEFRQVYEGNSDMAHFIDWGITAYNLYNNFPAHRVCLKGVCAEVARCFYHPAAGGRAIADSQQLVALEPGWNELEFIRKYVDQWFLDVRELAAKWKYDILDLFYWEHRMGSWQAQSQLEWDISIEELTPFNNRHLLDTLLGVPQKDRRAPDYTLFRRIMADLWPQVLTEPINPSIKSSVKRVLNKMGMLRVLWTLKATVKGR